MKIKYMYLLLLFCPLLSNSQSNQATLHFEPSSTTLNSIALQQLSAFQKGAQNCSDCIIYIMGHSDASGTPAKNLDLSYQRVLAVANQLSELGSTHRVSFDYFGESRPLPGVTNPALNRRVELVLLPENASMLQRKQASTNSIRNEKQEFVVDASQAFEIRTKANTLLLFDPNSFVDKNGNAIAGNIKIELEEYAAKKDFVRAPLSCETTDGILLESKGMFHIRAIQGSQELALADNASYSIGFFNKTIGDNMNLFYGKEDGSGRILWELANETVTLPKDALANWDSLADMYFGENAKNGFVEPQLSKLEYELNDYFRSQKLGWINCDKFSGTENPQTLTIQIKDNINARVHAIFEDRNSVLLAQPTGINSFTLSNLPLNTKITLIAIGEDNLNNLLYAKKEIVVGALQHLTLDMAHISQFEVRRTLATILF